MGAVYSQSKKINRDSIQWEKENPNWESNLFANPQYANKLEVSKTTNKMNLYSSMQKECRIIGYEKANKKSKKLIVLSIWTFDVKDNPSKCRFGSYYETSSMDTMNLIYLGKKDDFIKAGIFKNNIQIATVYFDKKWISFVNH